MKAASSRYQGITTESGVEEIMGNHSSGTRGMAGQQSRTQHWNWSCPSAALLKLLYLHRIIINEACYSLNTPCYKQIMLDWFCVRALLQLSDITKTQSAGWEERLPSAHSSWGRMQVGHSTPPAELTTHRHQIPALAAAPVLCAGRPRAGGGSPPEEMAWEGTGGNVLFPINVCKHLLEPDSPDLPAWTARCQQWPDAASLCRSATQDSGGERNVRYNLLLCAQVKVPKCEEAPK